MNKLLRLPFLFLLLFCVVSCGDEPPPAVPRTPAGPQVSARYANPQMWLCWPGRSDACSEPLRLTEMRPDGSKVVVQETRAETADKVDCFYVYPTVDLSLEAANHDDFSDLAPMIRVAKAQASQFHGVCRVFAPLYRQITIGTYLRRPEVKAPHTAVAVGDVFEAFAHYLANENHGRKIVLFGHSQGGEMLVALLKRYFDDDPAMREKLLLAMPIGWPMDTAKGQTTGGTFQHLPVCTRRDETGCVLGYRSYREGIAAPLANSGPPPGRESICVNPAELLRGPNAPFSRSLMRGKDGLATEGVLYRDFYRGHCVEGENGYRWLAVGEVHAPGDAREAPVNLDAFLFRTQLGLHILDYQFAIGDLVDLVDLRARALR